MLLLFSDLIVFLFSAPSRPPKIIGTKMNHSGTTINIAWEQVEPLTNESKVEGYKVSKNTVNEVFKPIELPFRIHGVNMHMNSMSI